MEDTLLYIACDSSVLIYNIRYSELPKFVSKLKLPYRIHEMSVGGHKLCVTNWILLDLSQMQVMDITDPFNPVAAGIFDFNYGITSLHIIQDTVYVTNYYSLWLIDISDIDQPTEIGHIETPDCAYDATVQGDYVYVADGDCFTPGVHSWLLTVNKSDPNSLSIENRNEVLGANRNIKTDGKYIYINAGMSGLVIFDINQPNSPVLTGCCYTQGRSGPFDINNDMLILFDGIDWILDESPFYMCGSNISHATGNLMAPITSKPGDLLFINVADREFPNIMYALSLSSYVNSITTQGNMAYAAFGGISDFPSPGGIAILDLSSSDSIYCISNSALPYNALGDMAIYNNYLLATDFYKGFIVVNIGDPANISVDKEINLPGPTTGITIKNNLAFVVSYFNYYIYDISDPKNPLQIGFYVFDSLAFRSVIAGDYAFIAGSGLVVLDISNPASPEFVTKYSYSGGPSLYNDLAIEGDYIYLLDGYGDFEIVNISDPTNPTLAGLYTGPGESDDIKVYGDEVYLARRTDGISIINVSDTDNIYLEKSINTLGNAWDIVVTGKEILVADFYGLARYSDDVTNGTGYDPEPIVPTSIHLCQNYPNPFNATTSISFTLDSRQNVNLEIFNILGQKVRTAVDDILSAGVHRYEWDGTDDGGTAVSSGV